MFYDILYNSDNINLSEKSLAKKNIIFINQTEKEKNVK